MKRFLQEVVWRLSLVAALLTCASLAAWGQEPENPDEETTEKVMHPVYINLQGNDIDINGPTEVADGEDFQFEIVGGEGGSSLSVYQDGKSVNIIPDGNVITVKNVTGTILISVSQAYYFTVDGVRYRTYVGSLDAFADGDNAVEVAPSSNVELKNYVEYDGVLYWVQNYYGCYNRFDNITSLTLPNTSMFYSSNTMNTLNGLKELHVKALSPDKYPMINDAFGDKDLTGVTLYVPEGCSGNYTGEPWSRFGSIKEEEAPTEFPIYMVGPGVADYSPQTAQKGEDLTVTFTLESGYYSMLEGSYSASGNLVDGDQRVNVVASNRTYKDDQFTYVLWDEMSTAGIIATSLPADTEELFIPAYVTNSDGNTYRVIFKSIDEKEQFIENEDYFNHFEELISYTGGNNEFLNNLITVVNIVIIVIYILLFILIIILTLNYLNVILNDWNLFVILGYKNKFLTLFYFLLFLIIYSLMYVFCSLVGYLFTNYIKLDIIIFCILFFSMLIVIIIANNERKSKKKIKVT